LCKTKRRRHKALKKESFPSTKVFLGVEISQMKRTKPLALDLNRTTTKLKEILKDKQEKHKIRKLNQV